MGKVSRPVFAAPVPIDQGIKIEHFDCGKAALNDWLRAHALKNEGKFSRSYVVCADGLAAGYYSIVAGDVIRAEAPPKLKRNAPERSPVVVLGRLAVDRRFHGRGLGASLLQDALRRSLTIAQTIGARAVLVHAIDRDAVSFYAAYGFKAFPDGGLTLFLPIEEIAAAL